SATPVARTGGRSADALHQLLAELHERARHGPRELFEELTLQLELPPPLLRVDGHRLLELLGGDARRLGVDGTVLGDVADRRLLRARLAVGAVEDPLEDVHVL